MTLDITLVAVRSPKGTWHKAYLDGETGVLSTPEACNLDDAVTLEQYPELPDWALARDLCKRCHPMETER